MMKVLVVDDEQDVKILFEQRFRREIKNREIEFAFAFSAEEALRFLHGTDPRAILILSDINMPGMSGLELLKKIRTQHQVPPPMVMMITAYGDEANHSEAMRLGADDFLTKPLDFEALKTKLKNAIV